MGVWRPDGQLQIVDRLKNLIKLKGGEYIAIESMEKEYSTSSYVSGVNGGLMCFGDSDMDRPVAFVVADEKKCCAWADQNGIEYGTFAELCASPEMNKEVLASLVKAGKSGKLGRQRDLSWYFVVAGHGRQGQRNAAVRGPVDARERGFKRAHGFQQVAADASSSQLPALEAYGEATGKFGALKAKGIRKRGRTMDEMSFRSARPPPCARAPAGSHAREGHCRDTAGVAAFVTRRERGWSANRRASAPCSSRRRRTWRATERFRCGRPCARLHTRGWLARAAAWSRAGFLRGSPPPAAPAAPSTSIAAPLAAPPFGAASFRDRAPMSRASLASSPSASRAPHERDARAAAVKRVVAPASSTSAPARALVDRRRQDNQCRDHRGGDAREREPLLALGRATATRNRPRPDAERAYDAPDREGASPLRSSPP